MKHPARKIILVYLYDAKSFLISFCCSRQPYFIRHTSRPIYTSFRREVAGLQHATRYRAHLQPRFIGKYFVKPIILSSRRLDTVDLYCDRKHNINQYVLLTVLEPKKIKRIRFRHQNNY